MRRRDLAEPVAALAWHDLPLNDLQTWGCLLYTSDAADE